MNAFITVTDSICPDKKDCNSVEPNCLLPAANFVYGLLERRYMHEFMKSIYYVKHQLDFLSQPDPPIEEIIHCDIAIGPLMEVH